jgi:hypothetical protein
MSIERKDIRAKLDPEIHAALAVICDADGVELGEFIEREIERVVRKRVHDAQAIAGRLQGWGKSGSGRE